MSLAALGQSHGTDKAAHGYLPLYERYLPKDVKSLLEIGVYRGSSLRMWRDHLPDTQVYGVDVDPGCKRQEAERIGITIASQDDSQALRDLVRVAGGFDVVVDDGSHVNELTIASFETLWPHTRKLYVIEDLGNSYVDLTPHISGWPGMEHNRAGLDYRNRRNDMDRFFTRLIRRVDQGEMVLHFHRDLCFIERL